MSDADYGSIEWGDDLDEWTIAYWKLASSRNAAYAKRGDDEQTVRSLKMELASAEAQFAASDAAAKELQRQVDDMLADGKEKGFSV